MDRDCRQINNTDIIYHTGHFHIGDIIQKRRNAICGHVIRRLHPCIPQTLHPSMYFDCPQSSACQEKASGFPRTTLNLFRTAREQGEASIYNLDPGSGQIAVH